MKIKDIIKKIGCEDESLSVPDVSYRITYERNGRNVTTTRKAATAQAAAEALCDQYGWRFRLKQYDADTRGGEWAECAAATDAYTDREIALHVERV